MKEGGKGGRGNEIEWRERRGQCEKVERREGVIREGMEKGEGGKRVERKKRVIKKDGEEKGSDVRRGEERG